MDAGYTILVEEARTASTGLLEALDVAAEWRAGGPPPDRPSSPAGGNADQAPPQQPAPAGKRSIEDMSEAEIVRMNEQSLAQIASMMPGFKVG